MQIWHSPAHGQPQWPDIDGSPLQALPKVMRSIGSHSWRLAPVTPEDIQADAAAGDVFGVAAGRSHGLGVTSLNGSLVNPD